MKIQVIIGSTREGRTTPRLAQWVASQAKQQILDADVELLDLAEYELPFFAEAISPQYNPERKPTGIVKTFLEKLAQADAYIIVTPEYNRSYSAVLKNALDYLDFQFEKKPVALVAHGSTGGAQAVSHLRGTLAGTLAITVPQATMIAARIGTLFSEDGTATADVAMHEHAIATTLQNLAFYSRALQAARV